MTKLINTNMKINQAYIYFNKYFTTSIYFRTGIVQLNKKQEAELKRIFEAPILWKLGLSVKFLKELLYARRSALSVGLITPNIVLSIVVLKLYICNIR